jgi:hypothetical protein
MKQLTKNEMKNLVGGVATVQGAPTGGTTYDANDYCNVNAACGQYPDSPSTGGTTVILNGLCACAINNSFYWVPPTNVC